MPKIQLYSEEQISKALNLMQYPDIALTISRNSSQHHCSDFPQLHYVSTVLIHAQPHLVNQPCGMLEMWKNNFKLK